MISQQGLGKHIKGLVSWESSYLSCLFVCNRVTLYYDKCEVGNFSKKKNIILSEKTNLAFLPNFRNTEKQPNN